MEPDADEDADDELDAVLDADAEPELEDAPDAELALDVALVLEPPPESLAPESETVEALLEPASLPASSPELLDVDPASVWAPELLLLAASFRDSCPLLEPVGRLESPGEPSPASASVAPPVWLEQPTRRARQPPAIVQLRIISTALFSPRRTIAARIDCHIR